MTTEEKPKFTTFVFDLDGTLLNTLPDLVELTNHVLTEAGYPTRTQEEILSFVGNGVRSLMSQAVPLDADPYKVERVTNRWKSMYESYDHLTCVYEGMEETLQKMAAMGVRMAVLSNKFDAASKTVIRKHLPGLFELVYGECEKIPRKPNPLGLETVIQELGVQKKDVVFVGDSVNDIDVAHNAGVCSIGVSWGYQDVSRLVAHDAGYIIHEPYELLAFVRHGR
ncbi:MAG: HAD family hydrolase [Eggerthellaceae bacterium]|jgi:phosphoglycolate phosphatase